MRDREKTVEKLRAKAAKLTQKAEGLMSSEQDASDSFSLYLNAKNIYQRTKKEHRRVFNAVLRQRATQAVTLLVGESSTLSPALIDFGPLCMHICLNALYDVDVTLFARSCKLVLPTRNITFGLVFWVTFMLLTFEVFQQN